MDWFHKPVTRRVCSPPVDCGPGGASTWRRHVGLAGVASHGLYCRRKLAAKGLQGRGSGLVLTKHVGRVEEGLEAHRGEGRRWQKLELIWSLRLGEEHRQKQAPKLPQGPARLVREIGGGEGHWKLGTDVEVVLACWRKWGKMVAAEIPRTIGVEVARRG